MSSQMGTHLAPPTLMRDAKSRSDQQTLEDPPAGGFLRRACGPRCSDAHTWAHMSAAPPVRAGLHSADAVIGTPGCQLCRPVSTLLERTLTVRETAGGLVNLQASTSSEGGVMSQVETCRSALAAALICRQAVVAYALLHGHKLKSALFRQRRKFKLINF